MNVPMRHLDVRLAVFVAVLAAVIVAGCVLDEPEVDERWTLVEFLDVSPAPGQTRTASQPIQVNANGRITYRRIVTGFLVAEVRYSDTISPQNVVLTPDDHTEACALAVDRILAASVSTGRATRAVTGFDHLMQDIDLSFTAQVPAAMATNPGGPGGLYLVLYMGSGEEIELSSGEDSLVVTPFVSSATEILHTGFPLQVTP
jgi:hypothetical protein